MTGYYRFIRLRNMPIFYKGSIQIKLKTNTQKSPDYPEIERLFVFSALEILKIRTKNIF
jgi:hypothetical protein